MFSEVCGVHSKTHGLSYLVWRPKLLVVVIHVHVVTIKLWTETERRNKHVQKEV